MEELRQQIIDLQEQNRSLRQLYSELKDKQTEIEQRMNKDVFSAKEIKRKRIEMLSNVYIKDIDDIALTAIGDTSSSDQSTNITTNLNKIINALNNK